MKRPVTSTSTPQNCLRKPLTSLKARSRYFFITHQLPKGLAVDEAILLGKDAVETNKQQQELKQDQIDIEVQRQD